jgi:hypothetical protein
MASILDNARIRKIEGEDSVRGFLVRRARLLAEKATEEEKPLLEEALREVMERLEILEGKGAP